MSRLLRDRTPAQLGWIIAVANLLAVSGFVTFFVDSFHRTNSQRLPIWAAILSLALLILGFVFEVFAESALKAGIGSRQWPEALIATTGKVFTHRAIPVVSLLLAVVAGIVVFLGSSHYAGLWVFVFPALSAARVRQIFNRTAYA